MVNIIGEKVICKHNGYGKIIGITNKMIFVQFDAGKQAYKLPESLVNKNLCFCDVSINSCVGKILKNGGYIDNLGDLIENNYSHKSNYNQNIYVKNLDNTIQTNIQKSQKNFNQNDSLPTEEQKSKVHIYFVAQGKTFFDELRLGILWAPSKQKCDKHYWGRLEKVKKGDIILHYSKGYICAISQVQSSCYESIAPYFRDTDEYNSKIGRQVDCRYFKLNEFGRLWTKTYSLEILDYNKKYLYSPFNKNADCNQGYLYDLYNPLAELFITKLIDKNPSLKQCDWLLKALQ